MVVVVDVPDCWGFVAFALKCQGAGVEELFGEDPLVRSTFQLCQAVSGLVRRPCDSGKV